MTRRNDQVFQLSLAEIAFILVFILLLLLGYLVFREQTAKEEAEAALAKTQGVEASAEALKLAKLELVQVLEGAGASKASLDDTISRLTAVQELRGERDRLKKQVDDLDAKLSAMTELQKTLEAALESSKQDAVMADVVSALTLQAKVREELAATDTSKSAAGSNGDKKVKPADTQKMLEQVRHAITTTSLLRVSLQKQLDQTLTPGQEAKTIDSVVGAAKAHAAMAKASGTLDAARKENSDLRGQVAYFKRRLEARGGRDYPPCWATESGSPEYIFSLELTPTGVLVKPSWPTHRENDARALPGIDAAMQSPVTMDAFVKNIQGIFGASKAADPQCRHYVFLKSTIVEAAASDRARLTVENYFYKNELRR